MVITAVFFAALLHVSAVSSAAGYVVAGKVGSVDGWGFLGKFVFDWAPDPVYNTGACGQQPSGVLPGQENLGVVKISAERIPNSRFPPDSTAWSELHVLLYDRERALVSSGRSGSTHWTLCAIADRTAARLIAPPPPPGGADRPVPGTADSASPFEPKR